MNNIILFDDENWKSFLPLTYTRPIGELRLGILTIREKWEKRLNGKVSYITQDYLSDKFPIEIANDNYVINPRWIPNAKLISLIKDLDMNDALLIDDTLVAARMNDSQFQLLIKNDELEELKGIDISKNRNDFLQILRPYDLNTFNGIEIENDFELLTEKRYSQNVNNTNVLINKSNIFVDEGATLNNASLNATDGPIYIGKGAEIMEGSYIRGPFSLCENATVKMGAKIYGETTIGPHSKVGGEISNTIIVGYSNKAHDGYLGNSYIGEWCNLGAGTNASNLKNNYTEVKVWDYNTDKFEKSGKQFCGLIMGDHSKCGIQTMFNTGTVVGVSANIFGSGYPRTFIPSFSWGGSKGYMTFSLNKSFEIAETVMARRSIELTEYDKLILEHIFHNSSQYRNWENAK